MRLPPCCVEDISAMSTPVGILFSAFAISRQRTPKGSPYLNVPCHLSPEKPHPPLHRGPLYNAPSPREPANTLQTPPITNPSSGGSPPCVRDPSTQQGDRNGQRG